MKKQFSVALLALAISQVSQAGIVGEVLGGIAGQAEPISGQNFSLGNNPVTNTQIADAIAQLDAALPSPLGSSEGGAPGLPEGFPPSGLPADPADLIAMIPVPAPGEGGGFEAPTLTAPQALIDAVTAGAEFLPTPDAQGFQDAAALVQATLQGAGGDGPSPQEQFLEGLAFGDAQLAKGIQDGSATFFSVIAVPAAEGQKLADGTYALQAAQTFATEFNAYNEQFAGDGGSPLAPFYEQQPLVQDQVFAALADGADQLVSGETTVISAISEGAFGAPAMIRESLPEAPSAGGGSGAPSLPLPTAGDAPDLSALPFPIPGA